jgi:Na+/proline symporter
MLIWFVLLYWIISVAIGLWAARRVHSTADFAVAGRSLPLYMITTMVFATWFGSEAVLGIPAVFMEEGLGGVVADPFGAGLCLILVGLFFAVPLYRMKLLTIGDYYKLRYGRTVEVVTSICVVISYLGWVAAQLTALGLVFNVVSDGAISREAGMFIGAASILVYTLIGGMWSVAVTDFVQMIIIIVGMVYIVFVVAGQVDGGAAAVVQHAAANGKFEFWPALEPGAMLAFAGAAVTLMLGSIPQQDVFQRVASSKNEKVARAGSVLGGSFYILFAFIPIFLAYSASLIDPGMVQKWLAEDTQMILPSLVMQHVGVFAQILFFGALLSAIKSCASATLLAPSVTFAENILRDLIPRELSDKENLRLMQGVVLVFAACVTAYAWYSMQEGVTIYSMVENAYKITLVACFVPLAFGLYWKRATNVGAMVSIVLGIGTWSVLELVAPEGMWPPQLAGLLAAIFGMVVGSLASKADEDPLTHHHAHRHGERISAQQADAQAAQPQS